MNSAYGWYQTLVKPSWAPPSWLFGPVWTVLYLGITVSFGTVFYKILYKQLPASLAVPFALNLVFNLTFSPIQFWLRNNVLAAADVLLVLGTLVWALVAVYPYLPWVTYFNLPYVAWVCFATALQISITTLNWK